MKRLVFAFAAAVVLTLAAAPAAQAGYIGTTPNTAPFNDVIGYKEGFFGENLYLYAGSDTQITIEYLGKEAGWINEFYFGGEKLVTTDGTIAVGTKWTPTISPGLIDFSFLVTNTGRTVANGSNTEPPDAPNFFISLGSPADPSGFLGDAVGGGTPYFGTTAIIALDDGGANVDDNHDDLVVRLTITNGSFSVPDGGATLVLLGAALIGLGALRRRFNA